MMLVLFSNSSLEGQQLVCSLSRLSVDDEQIIKRNKCHVVVSVGLSAGLQKKQLAFQSRSDHGTDSGICFHVWNWRLIRSVLYQKDSLSALNTRDVITELVRIY